MDLDKLSRIEKDPHVFINNKNIIRVTNPKTLGVFIDEEMTWKMHIDHLSKMVSKESEVLRKAKDITKFRKCKVIHDIKQIKTGATGARASNPLH